MNDRMAAQQLKNSILQMVVQGKLVEQDPNDEPASVLLERIREEKEKLIKEGKIKRNKKESIIFKGSDNLHYKKIGSKVKCIEDELPFEIPNSWEWVHLPNISESYLGKTLNKTKDRGIEKEYLCSINIQWNGICLETVKKALFTSEEQEKYRLKAGDLLICEGGEIGKSCVWTKQSEMYYQNALHRVCFFDGISPYFFKMLMEYYKKSNLLDKYAKGVTIKHLVQASLNSIFFPLPPINEQTRIINKLNKIDKYIEKYDVIEKQLFNLNSTYKEQLKKSILQYAIEGKLVEQDPNDESVEILLSKIKEEKEKLIKEGKIKRDKNESYIFKRDNSYYENINGKEHCIDDEIPFEIPDSWCWIRFKNLVHYSMGKTPPRKEEKYWINATNHWISISDMVSNGVICKTKELVNDYSAEYIFKNSISKKGTLIMSFKLTVGKVSILGIDSYHNEAIISIYPFVNDSLITRDYLFNTLPLLSQLGSTKKAIKGNTLNSSSLDNLLIPISSLNVQNKINKVIRQINDIL